MDCVVRHCVWAGGRGRGEGCCWQLFSHIRHPSQLLGEFCRLAETQRRSTNKPTHALKIAVKASLISCFTKDSKRSKETACRRGGEGGGYQPGGGCISEGGRLPDRQLVQLPRPGRISWHHCPHLIRTCQVEGRLCNPAVNPIALFVR